MLDSLRLPDVPRVGFESPPLELAVCQIRFPRVLSVAIPTAVAPFQEAIRERYPILKPVAEVGLQINLGPSAGAAQPTAMSSWQFSDADQNWTVVLSEDFITIETRRYDRFESFLERLQQVLVALVEYIRPAAVTRIGLRYINEIRLNDAEWRRILRTELLGPLAASALSDHAVQAVQEVKLEFDHGQALLLRHGLLPNGSTLLPRPGSQPPETPFYLLDLDASRAFPEPDLLSMNLEQISQLVSDYHLVIHRLFRWALTDQFTESLRRR